jgi:hypothetical protein
LEWERHQTRENDRSVPGESAAGEKRRKRRKKRRKQL